MALKSLKGMGSKASGVTDTGSSLSVATPLTASAGLTITGSTLTASNGLAVTGGANIAGGLTVTSGALSAPGGFSMPTLSPSGLTGAVAASRYVGGTVSGAPTSGDFLAGDYVVSQNGSFYVCQVSGTPGTWQQVGGSTFAGPLVVNFVDPLLELHAYIS